MRFSFEDNYGLETTLILLNNGYDVKESKFFFAKNGFTIFRSDLFLMFKSGSIHLPKEFNHDTPRKVKLSFISDTERYNFLKQMGTGLLEWSNSKGWEDFTEKEKIKLTFSNKVWVLF